LGFNAVRILNRKHFWHIWTWLKKIEFSRWLQKVLKYSILCVHLLIGGPLPGKKNSKYVKQHICNRLLLHS
jgi:hypothetical protein